MSWSGSGKVLKGSTDEEIDEQLDAVEIHGNDDCPNEREQAVVLALDCIKQLIQSKSNAIGSIEDVGFGFSISGHCNPGNKPRDGWANDSIHINVLQLIGDTNA